MYEGIGYCNWTYAGTCSHISLYVNRFQKNIAMCWTRFFGSPPFTCRRGPSRCSSIKSASWTSTWSAAISARSWRGRTRACDARTWPSTCGASTCLRTRTASCTAAPPSSGRTASTWCLRGRRAKMREGSSESGISSSPSEFFLVLVKSGSLRIMIKNKNKEKRNKKSSLKRNSFVFSHCSRDWKSPLIKTHSYSPQLFLLYWNKLYCLSSPQRWNNNNNNNNNSHNNNNSNNNNDIYNNSNTNNTTNNSNYNNNSNNSNNNSNNNNSNTNNNRNSDNKILIKVGGL